MFGAHIKFGLLLAFMVVILPWSIINNGSYRRAHPHNIILHYRLPAASLLPSPLVSDAPFTPNNNHHGNYANQHPESSRSRMALPWLPIMFLSQGAYNMFDALIVGQGDTSKSTVRARSILNLTVGAHDTPGGVLLGQHMVLHIDPSD